MLKSLIAGFVIALAGCAGTPVASTATAPTAIQQAIEGSPEAQIKVAGNASASSTRTLAGLLAAHKVTLAQAQTYRAVIASALDQLHAAERDLTACRAASGPATAAGDPCRLSSGELVLLALTNITNIKTALDAK
jgi:hypothetical protein